MKNIDKEKNNCISYVGIFFTLITFFFSHGLVTWTGISLSMTSSAFAASIHDKKWPIISYSGGFPLGSIIIQYFKEIGLNNEYLFISAILTVLQLAGTSLLLPYFHHQISDITGNTVGWTLF